MGWIIALLGLAASVGGGGAIVMGWPLVPLERGWTMVIAGAALGSGGLVCLALAVQIFEMRRTRLAIDRALALLTPGAVGATATASVAPSPAMLDNAADANRPASARPAQATGDEARSAPEGEAAAAGETQPARSFTVGDTTFVVFSDGSIEARTTEGTRRFRSMEEVRAYLETSESR